MLSALKCAPAYHGESKCGVDKPFGERDVAARNREVGNHLSEGDHNTVGDCADDGVAQQEPDGATVMQRTRCTQEETGTDNTANTADA